MNATTDWYEVQEIADGTYQITEAGAVLPCNMFLLDAGEEALLIDTGLGIGDLRGLVEDLTGGKIRVLLSHAHWDHIGNANQFDEVVINPRERAPDGTVAIDILEDDYDQRPGEFMADWLAEGLPLPSGFDPDEFSIDPVPDVGAIDPGSDISFGDRQVELVSIPGHTPGLVAAIDHERGICFGSDVLEPGIEIYAHFLDSDLDDYRSSIDRLIGLRDEGAFDTLTIGHGEPIRDGELGVLDEVSTALKEVVEGEPSYKMIETSWGATREYSFDGIKVLIPGDEVE